jgi:RNA polymerase sigma factor (sigma-70 family)
MLTSEPVPLPPDDDSANPGGLPSDRLLNAEQLDAERLLVDRHHCQRIAQIARKQTRGSGVDWEDAAAAAQCKILQAFRSGKFRHGDAAAFHRWACSVARFEIIDLVRKDKREHCASLDQTLYEGDTTWLEMVADDFNALESLVRSDLIERAIAAIVALDQAQPEKCFLKLWQAKLTDKRQAELAAELGLTQSAISKRWKELTHQLTAQLGWLDRPDQSIAAPPVTAPPVTAQSRQRSTAQW